MRVTTWITILILGLAAGLGLASVVVIAEPTRATLDADLSKLNEEITSAQADLKNYPAGLINLQIALRLQTLKTTRAMLEQKRASWLRMISLSYTVDGHAAAATSVQALAQLDLDMKKIRDELEANEAESAKYTGGLIQTMLFVTIATERSTLALAEMRYLTGKWGIPLILPSDTPQAPNAPTGPGNIVNDKSAF
jgi:hypothetical protein